jgi:4-alpha-glucanotransferase
MVQGIILHPACLPGRFGCGDLGPEAWQWLQILGEAEVPAWVLPVDVEDLNLLSFDLLHHDGALLPADMNLLPVFDDVDVDERAVREVRWAFLHLAARRFVCQCEASPLLRHSLESFCDDEAVWLDDVALFGALSDDESHQDWQHWPSALRDREPHAMAAAMVALEPQIEERKALHYLLTRQWRILRSKAQRAGVKLLALQRPHHKRTATEGWLDSATSLSDTRSTQHVDGLVTHQEVASDCWLDGASLFNRSPQAKWRFQWSEVGEHTLRRLLLG